MSRVVILVVLFAATLLALVLFDRFEDQPVQVITERHEAADVTIPIRYREAPPPTMPPGVATTTTIPAPKARTAPTRPAATTATIAELEQIIRDGFARFGAHVAEEAVRVAGCESTGDPTGEHLNPNATGAEGEVGLLQLHPRYQSERAAKFGWSMADLYDPAKNVLVAADLYAEKGWQPWSCRWAA